MSDSAKPGTWTYDNLNRMSSSPVATYTHDAVGNRLTKASGGSSITYGWDAVNRMIEAGPLTGSRHHYTYRADGMRVRKEIPGLVEKVYYDGQMPVETFEDFSTGNDKLTRNFVGARGIEMMETTGGNTTQAYPLYDTHGNMVATLSKNTAGTSWSLGNERSYDVWGSVRSGAATGGPKGRYVANLGHVADDESGLIYMRARHYEPESGRFVSRDSERDGANWYVYGKSCPTMYADATGNSFFEVFQAELLAWFLICLADPTAKHSVFSEVAEQLMRSAMVAAGQYNADCIANRTGCLIGAASATDPGMKSILMDMADFWNSRAASSWAEMKLIRSFGAFEIRLMELLLDLNLGLEGLMNL